VAEGPQKRLDIVPVPAFRDNYIWLVYGLDPRYVAIVDPGEADPVISVLAAQGLRPAAILVTHRHADHVGGIPALVKRYPRLPVFGPRGEAIPAITHRLGEGDEVPLPEIGALLRVLDVPGHTCGHIAYSGHQALFCGDTLFSVGCGRLFEGTPEQMHASLSKLAGLPAATRVYCAHEYTLENIGFAKWVEPKNSDLLQREEEAFELLDSDQATLPSTLEAELKTNPFLRVHVPTVISAAEDYAGRRLVGGADVFGVVRQWKDREYD
jgi:hydroxyacylglutathione hydrolase